MKMNGLMKVGNGLRMAMGRGALKIRKATPEILIVVGIGGVIGTVILACRSTLKLEDTLDQASQIQKEIENTRKEKTEEEYPDKAYQKDMVMAKASCCWEIAKLYMPSVGLGIISIGCITGSHVILKKRNLAAMGAYQALHENFIQYRKKVEDAIGKELSDSLAYDIKTEEVEEKVTDENGEEKAEKKVVRKIGRETPSVYARFFDEMSDRFDPESAELNLVFLRREQGKFNDLLRTRGHVFLNEVYDALGIPRSKAGAIVGWIMRKDENGDNFIDFGLDRWSPDNETTRRFVNGYQADDMGILLDFNVDGVIWDLI